MPRPTPRPTLAPSESPPPLFDAEGDAKGNAEVDEVGDDVAVPLTDVLLVWLAEIETDAVLDAVVAPDVLDALEVDEGEVAEFPSVILK